MEEFRDERLSKIMSWMQAWCRGYLSRKEFKKMQEQRVALEIVQRNLRKYLKLRTWAWWKLWQKVKPLLNVSRVEDQIAVSIFRNRALLIVGPACVTTTTTTISQLVTRLQRNATSGWTNIPGPTRFRLAWRSSLLIDDCSHLSRRTLLRPSAQRNAR